MQVSLNYLVSRRASEFNIFISKVKVITHKDTVLLTELRDAQVAAFPEAYLQPSKVLDEWLIEREEIKKRNEAEAEERRRRYDEEIEMYIKRSEELKTKGMSRISKDGRFLNIKAGGFSRFCIKFLDSGCPKGTCQEILRTFLNHSYPDTYEASTPARCPPLLEPMTKIKGSIAVGFRPGVAAATRGVLQVIGSSTEGTVLSRIKDLLYSKDLLDPVELKGIKPAEKSNVAWKKMNMKTISLIRRWIDDSEYHHVAEEEDAYKLWMTLESTFQQTSSQNKLFCSGS
ncbi:hypothetical protein AgCh_029112 [Apium graveolens]